MWPDRVPNPGPLTYDSGDDSGALPTGLRGPARLLVNNKKVCAALFMSGFILNLVGVLQFLTIFSLLKKKNYSQSKGPKCANFLLVLSY